MEPYFIQPEAVARMRVEAYRVRERTFWSKQSHNPYMTAEDPSLPVDHPKRFFERRTSGFINSDILEAQSDLRALYDWDAMTRFVGVCVGGWSIYYLWADPLARCPYAIMEDGDYIPWHFDGNEFTIRVSVEQPEQGGEFEYVPKMRSLDDESFEGVRRVLDGDRSRVHRLSGAGRAATVEGALFATPSDTGRRQGRVDHRITDLCSGSRNRHRPERAKQFYGYAMPMPIHYEREAKRPDRLTD
ncbi:hypothetical protein [Pseudomonas violetae]|uniref:Uncharacterized protein n=1 Tax=Pseudomonas violetae TaxID=2915813 RepID=A0ABT0ETR6_9PSED|nr:hypothetical protein [Pseudomonas violetae]MCK1788877.1 hypothetical protein [Pseudomonas violetae]